MAATVQSKEKILNDEIMKFKSLQKGEAGWLTLMMGVQYLEGSITMCTLLITDYHAHNYCRGPKVCQ